ncbi:MAG: hypothetical protein M1819_005505 [Sarea resinae]|nr:MAG: hypothetical protein M1819_005505 [Sarea resinae]
MASGRARLEGLKEAVYARCAQAPDENLFSQNDIFEMGIIPGKNANDLMRVMQGLIDDGLFKMLVQDGGVVWKLVKKEDAAKFKSFTPDEALLYNYIEAAGREGIWTKTLKARTNLHQTVQQRCLKSLESKNIIKSMKNVKFPTRKYFILASLQPAEETTGGPWFTDGELDVEFIDTMAQQIERYVIAKSWVKNSANSLGSKGKVNKTQAEDARARELGVKKQTKEALLPMPPGYNEYPTVSDIYKWVKNSNITPVTLDEAQIRQLLDLLVYDGKVEKVMGGIGFKAVRRPADEDDDGPGNGLTEAPCGRCPVFELCEEGGPVSASNCEYFKTWLDF